MHLRSLSLILIVIGMSGASCSKSVMKGNASRVASETKAGGVAGADISQDETLEPVASEPISVAGGFLYCAVTEDDQWKAMREDATVLAVVECFVGDAAKKPKQVAQPDAARFTTFTAEGQTLAVTASVFMRDEVSHWILPMKSYATPWVVVATFADESQYQCEIEKGAFSPQASASAPGSAPLVITSLGPELALNGNFSEPALGNAPYGDAVKSWDHFAPDAVNGWNAVWNNTSCGNAARIEIQRSLGGGGQQWLDLAGSCQIGVIPPAGGSNLKISQIIKTEVGGTYQLSFNYLLQKARISAFRVTRQDTSLFDSNQVANIKAGVWNAATLEFTANATETVLGFSEYGTDALEGTLLDNVSVKQVIRTIQK